MTITEIRERKKGLGWTNEDLARQSGVPLSTIAKILGGTTRTPRQESLSAMEKAILQGEASRQTSSGPGRYTPCPVYTASSDSSFVRESAYVYGSEARKDVIKPDGESRQHQPGEYTIEDYLALPDDRRVELIDGHFYTMAAPSGIHQKILLHIWKTLDTCIEEHGLSCETQAAPFDVQLFNDPFTVVQPDVMVFCTKPEEALKSHAQAAPDFIAEILSPSTGFRDRTQKLCRYRDAGVREVWIVSPAKARIWVYRFYDGCEDPDEYTFHDSVPLGISDKRCSVDFSKLLKYIQP